MKQTERQLKNSDLNCLHHKRNAINDYVKGQKTNTL